MKLFPKKWLPEIGTDPYLDWTLIVAVSVVIAICLAILGTFSYADVAERLSQEPASPQAAAASIDAQSLSSVLSGFDARSAEQSLLLGGYSGPGDPSI